MAGRCSDTDDVRPKFANMGDVRLVQGTGKGAEKVGSLTLGYKVFKLNILEICQKRTLFFQGRIQQTAIYSRCNGYLRQVQRW
jgi:hypothetical protein